MKDGKLITLAIVDIAIIGGVLALGWALQKGCTPKGNVAMTPRTKLEEDYIQEKVFLKGEHVISIGKSSHFMSDEVFQVPYYEGYQVLNVSIDDGNMTILYVNTEDVVCTSTGLNEQNEFVYTEFGTPQNTHTNEEGIFDVGQHIIARPITNPMENNQQYEQHENYEIMSIDYYNYGKGRLFGGGWIFYRNTEPVKCTKTKDSYTMFGEAIEDNKVLTK